MIEPIIQFFEKLVTQFSWGRLLFVFAILAIVIGSALWYETYTGHFRLGRIDRATELLGELVELSNAVHTSPDKTLNSIYDGLKRDLAGYVNTDSTAFSVHPAVLKGMAAAAPWIFLSIILPLLSKGGNRGAITGIAIFAIPLTVLGAYLPDFQYPWLNYIVYPLVSFSVVVWTVMWWDKRKKALTKASS